MAGYLGHRELGSFRVFRPLAPCSGRAELGLFRTKAQGAGAGNRVSTRRSLIPESRPLSKLGSFCTFDPTRLGSFSQPPTGY